ncbi:MAG: methylthioadenosine phosphorylase [Candidatus Fischerbacteria bacterium RBG_13_37_8]|uniref:S-methyl-5'-thioadenosine phosphorylase n=1 Tax=Candidatus Fischerbacteria bacterium RBG_13_37_8 TaxID=1817863 RepID=A0A1F5V8G8_9BACT|nr:MAG: methylthioadenosine phosphorylase [Candidatus Fischerbacteria bacterium RBG_13_37_8]
MPRIGIIGGSGLYNMNDLNIIDYRKLETPFGDPSDSYMIGTLEDKEVVFLARHGRGHILPPSDINYRANIYGFKVLGVEWLIGVSAVGSMRKELKPTYIVLPDQFYDLTKKRVSTFFGKGLAVHIAFADPVCNLLNEVIYQAALKITADVRKGGTYLCIEGPQFSTKAESFIYRNWGIDIIGMTNMPEAKLAREAEMCYSTIAMVTDYDVWHETEASVSVDQVVKTFAQNIATAQQVLREVVKLFPLERNCHCHDALNGAFITSKEFCSNEMIRILKPIVGKYFT